MRWTTGTTYKSKIPPVVTESPFPSGAESEIKIDFRGLGVYLSKSEATQLANDLLAEASRESA